jgi:hypothetical protein
MMPMLDAFDADVLLCTIAGIDHNWRPEDRTPAGVKPGNPYYVCSVCIWCHAARCGHLSDPDPCLEPRHHTYPHHYRSGATREVGK